MSAPSSSGRLLSSRWPLASAVAGVSLGLLVGYFPDVALSVGQQWWHTGRYRFAPIILAVCAYLVWRQRGQLRELEPAPDLRALALVAVAAGGLWVGSVTNTQILQHIFFFGAITALVPTIFGGMIARRVRFALAYIWLAAPVWDFLRKPLQDLTAGVTAKTIQGLGVPLYAEGPYLSIPSGDFVVAEVCGGLQYLLSAVAVGMLYARLRVAPNGRLKFVLTAAGLAIVMNWVRVIVIVLIGHASNMKHPLVTDHAALGWVLFAALFAALFRYGHSKAPPLPLGHAVVGAWRRPHAADPAPRVIIAGVAWMLILAVPSVASHRLDKAQDTAGVATLVGIPAAGAWRGPYPADIDWGPVYRGADVTLLQRYESRGQDVFLFIAYYRTQRQGAEVVNGRNAFYAQERWRPVGESARTVALSKGRTLPLVERVIQALDGRTMLLWDWYYVGGTYAASPYGAKLAQMWTAFGGRQEAAAIAVAVEDKRGTDRSRQILGDFVRTMEAALLASLDGAGTRLAVGGNPE